MCINNTVLASFVES